LKSKKSSKQLKENNSSVIISMATVWIKGA
jgi:hypothetical protein